MNYCNAVAPEQARFRGGTRKVVAPPPPSGLTTSHAQGRRVGNSEVLVDLPGGGRAVECVEVNAPHAVVQKVAALLGGPVDADAGQRRVVTAAADGAQKRPGEARPQG